MRVTIQPGQIMGSVLAPASKSDMQRACAAALLARGTTNLRNPGRSEDDIAALKTIQKLGATVQYKGDNEITIISQGIKPVSNEINCGESGLGVRMFTPIAALADDILTITGKGSLLTRPVNFFDHVLPELGVSVQSENGSLPVTVRGPLRPANIEVDGGLSSQFLTGLLMAFSASDAKDVTISVANLKSKPYIDLTLKVMKYFGMKVPENQDYQQFYFQRNEHHLTGSVRQYIVEGDWSGAAFLLVAGAIAGQCTVYGLDVFSRQADKAILTALSEAGASLSIQEKEITVRPSSLKAFQFDATDCPDLFPPLAALAAFCKGTSVIIGVSRLAHKESNRGITLKEELGKLGVKITLQDDLMVVEGGAPVSGGTIHSRHDHRIAMAGAVVALRVEGQVAIESAGAVAKSFPDFFEKMAAIGAKYETD